MSSYKGILIITPTSELSAKVSKILKDLSKGGWPSSISINILPWSMTGIKILDEYYSIVISDTDDDEKVQSACKTALQACGIDLKETEVKEDVVVERMVEDSQFFSDDTLAKTPKKFVIEYLEENKEKIQLELAQTGQTNTRGVQMPSFDANRYIIYEGIVNWFLRNGANKDRLVVTTLEISPGIWNGDWNVSLKPLVK